MSPHSDTKAVRKKAYQLLEKLYTSAIKHWPNFQVRQSQKDMMKAAIEALVARDQADLADDSGAHIALIEGQTGTGKTIGYLLPLLAVSVASGRTGLVSTATVALQEQLHDRDLPCLMKVAEAAGVSFRFALAKGMQRFICRENLQYALASAEAEPHADSPGSPVRMFRTLQDALDKGTWDGDRDSWGEVLGPSTWSAVEVDRSSCPAKNCQSYGKCAYFNARRRRQGAGILVTNHALVLSYLSNASPQFDPSKLLMVFDEGHHLPEIATDHFARSHLMIGGGKHLSRLGAGMEKAANFLAVDADGKRAVANCRQQMRALGGDLQRLYAILDQDFPNVGKTWRFANGAVPPPLKEPLRSIEATISVVLGGATHLLDQLMADSAPKDVASQKTYQQILVDLGRGVRQLDRLAGVTKDWLHQGRVPKVKWVERVDRDLLMCSSNLTAASQLRSLLWGRARAAVVTSATMTACGDFGYFESVAGLKGFREVTRLVARSPFDYEQQARILVPKMRSTPKQPMDFLPEMLDLLLAELPKHRTGQMVLFASKRQMDAVYAALPPELKERVLRQGDMPKAAILEEHRRRIGLGLPSIIFGMQSFGEGIDLPGQLLEHLYIEKVPFTPPDGVVEEALAEWLIGQNRDPFGEITVPKAAQKLSQWTGRGIRTPTDQVVIWIFDTRLVTKGYGKEILKGLPPIPVVRELF